MGGWLVNKDLQKLQALMMIQMRVGQNMTYDEIGKAMNVHRETVERRMIFAEKAGMFLDLEQQIMSTLVPKAMKAIETALEDGDSETALEILKSVGVLRDRKAQKTKQEESDDNELFDAITGAREQRTLDSAVIDATVVGRSGLAGLLEEGGAATSKESSEDGNLVQPTIVEVVAETPKDDCTPRHEVRVERQRKKPAKDSKVAKIENIVGK